MMARKRSTPDSNPVVEETSPGHQVKERMVIGMWHIKSMLVTFTILVAIAFSIGETSASADSVWQCNNYPGNTITSTSAWLTALGNEGVVSQAKSEIFDRAGYHSTDQTVGQWLNQRVEIGAVSSSFSGMDYSCHDGVLSTNGAGYRSYAAGERVMFVLPSQYDKSSVSLHKTATHTKAVRKSVLVIGLSDCGNTFWGHAYVTLWVATTPKTQPPTPTPPATVECSNGSTAASITACPVQSNSAEQNCEVEGGNWNNNTGLCTIVQVVGNCSNIIVVNGSGDTVSSTQEGNCDTTPPPPATCPTGDTGTYPNCSSPTCPSGDTGTYPACIPPQSIEITVMPVENQIPVGCTSECTSGQLWITVNASDSGGSLTIDPGIGSVSTCSSSTPLSSVTFSNLGSGSTPECYILYAPDDSDNPTSMTVKYSAILGSASDIETKTFGITYPTRPS